MVSDPDPVLFVSHVSEDRMAAMEIVGELERRGVRCWIAPRNVRPGHPFDDEIVEAIEASRAMLLVFSDRCNESEYIRREVTVAGESQKIIIPFRIEDVQPRRGLRVRLSDLHWIDGFAAREGAIDELAEHLTMPERAAAHRREEERLMHEAEDRRRREEEQRAAEAQRTQAEAQQQRQDEERRRQPEVANRRKEGAVAGAPRSAERMRPLDRRPATRAAASRTGPGGASFDLVLAALGLVLALYLGGLVLALGLGWKPQ